MTQEIQCKECAKYFYPNRSNQLYDSNKCRNKYNMKTYRKKRLFAMSQIENANTVDGILRQYFSVSQLSTIDQKKLDLHKIGAKNCTFLHQVENDVVEMRFIKFKLVRINNNLFKILKNETTI